MIDLHSHILPGVDDGSPDVATSIEMARMAAADGITHLACTPHVTPGIYDTSVATIATGMAFLRETIAKEGIPLELVMGADAHLDPKLLEKLDAGAIPTLNRSRYFLFEPPHHVVPLRVETMVSSLVDGGYVPIITHPERLTWIESRYDLIGAMISKGAMVQLTAGSVLGLFGRRPKYWSERMLDEGIADIVASDAHNTSSRPPLLARARDAIAVRLGEEEAMQLVYYRPGGILNNEQVSRPKGPLAPQSKATGSSRMNNWVKQWTGRG